MAEPRDHGRTRAASKTDPAVLPPAEMAATIDRLRAIAADSGDRLLLSDGPPNPDHKLLDLCAEALHWRRQRDQARIAWRAEGDATHKVCGAEHRSFTKAEQEAYFAGCKAWQAPEKSMARILFEAKKIRAQTAAGIYAKALIVRSTQTGATLMAMSLADDLIACPGLRESLWPAKAEG